MDTKVKNAMLGLVIAVFVLTRVLVSSSEVMLGQDNPKYLITADNFPKHTLYNGQIYLLHPPLFPYFIHMLNWVISDTYKSALLLIFVSSALLLLILYKFFMLITKSWRISFLVVALYTLSVSFIDLSVKVLRESFVVMLVFLCLYLYIKGVKEKRFDTVVFAGIVGMVLAATSDHVIFIFPSILLAYFMFKRGRIGYKFLAVPLIMVFAVYMSWNAVRYYEYSSNEYYPNGVEGSIISTKNVKLWNLVTPFFFENANEPYIKTDIMTVPKKIIFSIGYMFNMEPFRVPPGLNLTTMKYLLKPIHLAFMALIYLPLAVIAAIGMKKSMKEKRYSIYLFLVFVFFLFPLAQKVTPPRHLIVASIFLFYFIASGICWIGKKQRTLDYFVIGMLVFVVPFWIATHHHIVFLQKIVPEPQNTIGFIKANIPQTVSLMVQPGYGLRIMEGTGNNVIGMPQKPDNLMELAKMYNTGYFIFSRIYTESNGMYSVETINYIENDPSFKLIVSLDEDYSRFYQESDSKRNDTIKIYRLEKK